MFFIINSSDFFHEALMKFKNLYAGMALSFLSVSWLSAAPVPQTGLDNRVEWQLKQQWETTGKTIDMVHSLDGKFVYILNDKHQVQVFTNQGKLQGSIPVNSGVSAIDIAPQGETLYLIDNKTNSFSTVSVSFVYEIDTTGSPFEGAADAAVTIAVFTDFE